MILEFGIRNLQSDSFTSSESAKTDLRRVHAFIAKDSRVSARRMVARIKKAVERLKRFPGSGAQVHEWDRPDLREVLVGNYRVIHHLHERHDVILSVIHAASRLPDDPDDLMSFDSRNR
jgi:toxin ParE1/3/4